MNEVYYRKATLAGPAPNLDGAPSSLDLDNRSVVIVAVTETPAQIFDFDSRQVIDEILLADGGEFPARFPLLKDHNTSTDAVAGVASNARRVGTEWEVRGAFDETTVGEESWRKVKSGSVRNVSIGYRVFEWVTIAPGDHALVAGRMFRNDGDRWLRVVTKWRVHEVSLVVYGADPNAKIRSAESMGRNMTTAIQSRNSVTGVIRRQVAALAICIMGNLDISRCRASDQDRDEAERVARNYDYVRLVRNQAERDGVRFNDSTLVGFQNALAAHYSSSASRASIFSTSNLPGMFQDILVAVQQAREDIGQVGWCSQADQSSTKAGGTVVVSPAAELEEIPRGGSAPHVDLDSTNETIGLKRRGLQATIDEQDLTDSGAPEMLVNVANALYDAAAKLDADAAYGVLTANAVLEDTVALFHADHGNLSTGALAGPTFASVAAKLMKANWNGKVIGQQVGYLIVPTELHHNGLGLCRLIESLVPGQTKPPVVIPDARLSAVSATTWYLASGQLGVELRYLLGMNRQPRLRSSFLSQGEWGVNIDVEHYVAAHAISHLGLQRADA